MVVLRIAVFSIRDGKPEGEKRRKVKRVMVEREKRDSNMYFFSKRRGEGKAKKTGARKKEN